MASLSLAFPARLAIGVAWLPTAPGCQKLFLTTFSMLAAITQCFMLAYPAWLALSEQPTDLTQIISLILGLLMLVYYLMGN